MINWSETFVVTEGRRARTYTLHMKHCGMARKSRTLVQMDDVTPEIVARMRPCRMCSSWLQVRLYRDSEGYEVL